MKTYQIVLIMLLITKQVSTNMPIVERKIRDVMFSPLQIRWIRSIDPQSDLESMMLNATVEKIADKELSSLESTVNEMFQVSTIVVLNTYQVINLSIEYILYRCFLTPKTIHMIC